MLKNGKKDPPLISKKTSKAESDDDEECWGKVNQIWTENQLNKEDSLRMTQVIPHIQDYMRQLGIDVANSTNEDMQKIFDDIDEDSNGTIERGEMYQHLKRAKKLEIAKVQTPTNKTKANVKINLDQQLWEKIKDDWKEKNAEMGE